MTTNPIDEAIAHLGAALMVANETDEPIIMDHVRAAHELLKPLHSAKVGRRTGDRIWDSDGQRWLYPTDYAIHHLDGDPTNNDPANLRAVPIREKRLPFGSATSCDDVPA